MKYNFDRLNREEKDLVYRVITLQSRKILIEEFKRNKLVNSGIGVASQYMGLLGLMSNPPIQKTTDSEMSDLVWACLLDDWERETQAELDAIETRFHDVAAKMMYSRIEDE